MQPSMDAVERRKIQNRHAQRRFRSKKATQNGGEPFTTAAAPSAAATASGPTIQPRPQSNHDVLAWGSEGRLSHPHATGLQTSEQDQVPPSTTANSSHTLQGDATITGLLRQLQDPLTSSSLRPHPQMNMTDFNFLPSMTQSRHAVLWPHDPPAEAMVFSTDDAGGFYADQDTNRTTWPDTGPSRTQSGSESSNDMSQVNTRITTPNDLDDDEPFQTNLHIAAEAGHDSLVGLLLGSGYTVDEHDSDGNTALHRASLGKHVKVMLRLLKAGANPNAMNVHGWTPVHMAFSLGSMEVVEVLVRNGGDLNKRAKGKLSCDKFKEALAAKDRLID